MKQLDSRTFVSGQVRPEDVLALAAAGVTSIVNNRPDGEEPGQPTASEIEAVARAAGLRYCHIPIAGALAACQVEAMAEALGEAEGKTLAFCRSGTRSTYLWALARSRQGEDADTIEAQAAVAGYDLTPVRRFL